MSRVAFGFSNDPAEPDRPTWAFIELVDGVLVHRRGEPAPRLIDDALDAPGTHEELHAGDPRYFDAVLVMFSTNCVIRTVEHVQPALIATKLAATDEAWEVLGRTGVPA